MSLSPRAFSTLPSLPGSSDTTNASLAVVPWFRFGASRPLVDSDDGRHVGWVDLTTGHRSVALPELKPAFEVAASEAEDASDPRRALAQAIEFALIEGLASQDRTAPPETTVPAETASEDQPPTMRHAYRGKQAFSSWDLSARGRRLAADELDRPAPMDPRAAYQNSAPAGRLAEVAHLFG